MIKTYSCRGASFQVVCVETVPQHPSWYSFEDEAEVRERLWRIEPRDLVLDIGAAYGSYTLSALALGASFAIAWSPQGFPGDEMNESETLRASVLANGWIDRCVVRSHGFYSGRGWLNTMTQEFVPDSVAPSDDVTKALSDPNIITVLTLDDPPLPPLARKARMWMKLDVEGAELEVLKGGEKFIATHRPRILVENHLFKRPTIEQEVREWLLARGYVEESTTPYHSVSHSLYLPGEG